MRTLETDGRRRFWHVALQKQMVLMFQVQKQLFITVWTFKFLKGGHWILFMFFPEGNNHFLRLCLNAQ